MHRVASEKRNLMFIKYFVYSESIYVFCSERGVEVCLGDFCFFRGCIICILGKVKT